MVAFKYGCVQIRLRSNTVAFKYGRVQIRLRSNMVAFKYGCVQIWSRSNTVAFKYGCVQIRSHSNMVAFKYGRMNVEHRTLKEWLRTHSPRVDKKALRSHLSPQMYMHRQTKRPFLVPIFFKCACT